MHKYWKRPVTLTVIVLLVFMMTLPLTACQIEIPGIGTVNIKDSDLPNNGGNMSGDDGGDDVDGVNTEGGYDDSLDLLRKEMDAPSYMLAAAYIGSAAGGPDDFERPMRDWVNEAAPELCAKYPFLRDIPRERVVGSGGNLYCVVPRDPNASLEVNRIRWNAKTDNYEIIEELYRSQIGEPILLLACAEMQYRAYPDTEVVVTDSTGRDVAWYPIYGAMALPYDFYNDVPQGYDFTVYTQEENGDIDGDVRWTGATGEQLTEYIWTWEGDYENQPAMATMALTQGNSADQGRITFKWWYSKDNGDPQEVYEGDWLLTDGGKFLGLTMTRSGGRQYKKGEASTSVEGAFRIQVPEAFDIVPVLNISEGAKGERLPIQQIPNELLMFNPSQG